MTRTKIESGPSSSLPSKEPLEHGPSSSLPSKVPLEHGPSSSLPSKEPLEHGPSSSLPSKEPLETLEPLKPAAPHSKKRQQLPLEGPVVKEDEAPATHVMKRCRFKQSTADEALETHVMERCRFKQSQNAHLASLPPSAPPQEILSRLRSFADSDDGHKRGRGRPKGTKNKRSQPDDGFDDVAEPSVKAARPGKRTTVSIWAKVQLLKEPFFLFTFSGIDSRYISI